MLDKNPFSGSGRGPPFCNISRSFSCCMLSRFSHVNLFATLWIRAFQALLSMGFSGQEYLSGLTCPSPRDFPDPGIEPRSPALQAYTLLSEPPGKSLIVWLLKFLFFNQHYVLRLSHISSVLFIMHCKTELDLVISTANKTVLCCCCCCCC